MLQNESILEVADNSGAQRILVIRCLGGSNRRYSRIGDLVVATVKKAKPNCEVKKSQIVLALVVTTKKYLHRVNNTWIKFSNNYAVIVKKDDRGKYKLAGTRILIPLVSELYKREEYREIVSLSQGML